MNNGFKKEIVKVKVYQDEIDAIKKKYKNIKKYIHSPLFTIRSIDGTEKVVSKLIEEYNENPID